MPYSRLGHWLIVSCSTGVGDFFPPPFMKKPGDCPWVLAKQAFQFLMVALQKYFRLLPSKWWT